MGKITFKHNKIICCSLSFFAFVLVFIAGLFSFNTQLENIANYATYVVVNHTKQQKLCAISVENTESSGPILDFESEFLNLYGTFKQNNITFASVMNSQKNMDIRISDDVSDNLSILYGGPSGSIEYNGHYKHMILPLELMFESKDYYDLSRFFAYISKTHADRLLALQNAPKDTNGLYTTEAYQSLQGQLISIEVNGISSNFAIVDIFYETNYYYEGLNDTIGDFIMCSYYLPNNLRDTQANLYFMNAYSFQNKYFMNYLNNAYSSGEFNLSVVKNNIVGEVDYDYLTSFYYCNHTNLMWVVILFIVLSACSLLLSFLLTIFRIQPQKNAYIFVLLLFSIIPYIIFSLVYLATGFTGLFSETSTKTFSLMFLLYSLTLFVSLNIKQRKKRNREIILKKEHYNEIII